MKKLISNSAVFAILGSVLPILALAQVQQPTTFFSTFEEIVGIIQTVLNWTFTIFLIVAAIMIVIAAFYYLTAGGDETKLKTAKTQFIYAVVAIAVALVAVSIQFVVRQLLGS